MTPHIIEIIESAFNSSQAYPLESVQETLHQTLQALDEGKIRVCEKKDNKWHTYEWIKKAILLSFKLNSNRLMEVNGITPYFDRVALKTSNWREEDFKNAGFRSVPGSLIRHGAYVDKNVILMPSFINIGAYIGRGTMIDTWVTIGSCAQIGENCHISGGVGIGGVLEPLQASPVIIEDNCFIGARSEIAEGVIVEEGAVISMGVFIGASTKIIDRESGNIFYGRVPAYSVVVPGTLPPPQNKEGPHLACAVIVKKVDSKTRQKTSINQLLRDAT